MIAEATITNTRYGVMRSERATSSPTVAAHAKNRSTNLIITEVFISAKIRKFPNFHKCIKAITDRQDIVPHQQSIVIQFASGNIRVGCNINHLSLPQSIADHIKIVPRHLNYI